MSSETDEHFSERVVLLEKVRMATQEGLKCGWIGKMGVGLFTMINILLIEYADIVNIFGKRPKSKGTFILI